MFLVLAARYFELHFLYELHVQCVVGADALGPVCTSAGLLERWC